MFRTLVTTKTSNVWLAIVAVGFIAPLALRATPESDSAPPLERRAHLDLLGVTRWHEQGHRGQGIKVAVLDTGFRGWRQHLGRGLPERVTARSFRPDGDLEARDSQHGILCAEILHALAPDAEILFANWDTDAPASFLQAVRWAKDQGARVLNCCVIMPSWSDGDGGGQIHKALDAMIGDDLLFFASAGNTAQRHWLGTLAPDDQGWHRWQGNAVSNTLEPWGHDRVAVELYGPLNHGGVLQVWDASAGSLIGQASLRKTLSPGRGPEQAVVRFDPAPKRSYQICVKCPPGSKPRDDSKFHLIVLGGSLEFSHANGSISFPADGARVVAVGAVDQRKQRAPYSSCGPNSRRPKPDFVAMVPFTSQCRERPFSGTSAAAPQAAALSALWWARHPQWSAPQVHAALQAAAADLGPAGHDCETGFGLVRLP
jgi:subtilisin family serine protease